MTPIQSLAVSPRWRFVVLLALAALVLAFHGVLKKRPTDSEVDRVVESIGQPERWTGKVAPDFELTSLKGEKFRLQDNVGKKVIILNFFATWCAPCRAEMPELNRFAASQSDLPVVLIGIDQAEGRPLVEKFVKEVGVTFPIAIDDGEVAHSYGVKSYPTTVMIGADGRIKIYETGAIANAAVVFGGSFQQELEAARKGRGISRENYLVSLRQEDFGAMNRPRQHAQGRLEGRARGLAEKMACVCGCDIKLMECTCSNGRGMKKRLGELASTSESDVAIMEAVNKEFCMKGMD
jgi:thiol-disulfide isomerase/thioredoxin